MEIRSSHLHNWHHRLRNICYLSLCLFLTLNHKYTHTHKHACILTHTRKTHCRERQGAGDNRHSAHKSKKSYTVIVISAIIFITITIITITVLPHHMYPIPRIISLLSVAPGGCVIVCWCADTPAADGAVTPVDSQPDVFFFFSPLILGRRLCQVHRGNRGMVL